MWDRPEYKPYVPLAKRKELEEKEKAEAAKYKHLEEDSEQEDLLEILYKTTLGNGQSVLDLYGSSNMKEKMEERKRKREQNRALKDHLLEKAKAQEKTDPSTFFKKDSSDDETIEVEANKITSLLNEEYESLFPNSSHFPLLPKRESAKKKFEDPNSLKRRQKELSVAIEKLLDKPKPKEITSQELLDGYNQKSELKKLCTQGLDESMKKRDVNIFDPLCKAFIERFHSPNLGYRYKDPNTPFLLLNKYELDQYNRTKDRTELEKKNEAKVRAESYAKYFPVMVNLVKSFKDFRSIYVIDEFEKAFSTIPNPSDPFIKESWKVLSFIASERIDIETLNPKNPRFQQFSHNVNLPLSSHNEPEQLKFRELLRSRSLKYLHESYLERIDDMMYRSAGKFPIDRLKKIHDRIDVYLEIEYFNSNIINDASILNSYNKFWAHFYCLCRCGLYNLALEYAYDNIKLLVNDDEIQFIDIFQIYLASNKMLDEEKRKELYQVYRTFNGNTNPFKALLWKMVGKFDVKESFIPGILRTFDDYLWVQLNMVQESYQDYNSKFEPLTMIDIQEAMIKCRPQEHQPETIISYFNSLLLTHQFEEALSYLMIYSQFQCDALHFCITLVYYGLLRTQTTMNNIDSNYVCYKDINGNPTYPKFNVYRLLGRTLPWLTNYNPEEIIYYYITLCILPTENHSMFLSCITELAHGTGKYGMIFGDGTSLDRYESGMMDLYKYFVNESKFEKAKKETLESVLKELLDSLNLDDAFKLATSAKVYKAYAQMLNDKLNFLIKDYFKSFMVYKSKILSKDDLIKSIQVYAQSMNAFYNRINHEARLPDNIYNHSSFLLPLSEFVIAHGSGDKKRVHQAIFALPYIPITSNYKFTQDFIKMGEQVPEELYYIMILSLKAIIVAIKDYQLILYAPPEYPMYTKMKKIVAWIQWLHHTERHLFKDYDLQDLSEQLNEFFQSLNELVLE